MDYQKDKVVRELDVYLCNDFVASATQLYILQQPLRPPWRPYDFEDARSVRIKPQARKMEISIPLDQATANYNDTIEPHKQIKACTLQSTAVETKTCYAVGYVKDGKLMLAPVDWCLQLRPDLSYLNVEKKEAEKADENDEEEDSKPSLQAVEVTVKRHETERQKQAHLNSYAFMMQKELNEPWRELKLHHSDSAAASGIWDKLFAAKDEDVPHKLSREAYLKTFVPSEGAPPQTEPPNMKLVVGTGAEGTSPEVLEALKVSVAGLFDKHSVCSMANIRQWLLEDPAANAAREAAYLTDRALHDAMVAAGNLLCIRRMYVRKSLGNPSIDPFRAAVLELLKDKETFRRSDVMDAALAAKVTVTDTLYNKVVKDLCMSRGNNWFLKSGADF